MPVFAASRFLVIGPRISGYVSLPQMTTRSAVTGFLAHILATVASFTPTSGSSTPSSPSSSLEDSSACFPSPWFMPPPPPPTPSPSTVNAASTRSSTSKRVGRPTVEIGYDDALAETAGTVTTAKGLEHFVGLAEREEKECTKVRRLSSLFFCLHCCMLTFFRRA
jgi:hypothetical protein